ncbi:redoxin domain-containing protein [Endozoicomonas sp. SCSIO W0465]|uniref:redoxin domain-containing protein n=1 Tax=Endozoicomonas sp. SCSIO W0465 TaxID=2918516 RepID=UPI0020752EAD|nr:redoxin domain-containing protein [Endozoicomonas sp. SCSIO W0465]USE38827.1 redoxin domain-containing protein [Endozoicomonas sp. SCSIO W0465]
MKYIGRTSRERGCSSKPACLLLLITLMVGSFQSALSWGLVLGDIAPDFKARLSTTDQPVWFYDWIQGEGGRYTVLFSHPQDFTPVCTTELAEVQKLMPSFKKRGVNVIGLSLNTAETHQQWLKDVAAVAEVAEIEFPLIADVQLKVAKLYGMLPSKIKGGLPRSAEENKTVRSVFIINNKTKAIEVAWTYPMQIGRSFDELSRVLDALDEIAWQQGEIATPANWHKGDDVILAPGVDREHFAEKDLPTGKSYMRYVPAQIQGEVKGEEQAAVMLQALEVMPLEE